LALETSDRLIVISNAHVDHNGRVVQVLQPKPKYLALRDHTTRHFDAVMTIGRGDFIHSSQGTTSI
jgi:hypothetical protein